MWKDHISVSLRSTGLFQIQTILMRLEIDTAHKPGNSGTFADHLSLVIFLASFVCSKQVHHQKTTLIISKDCNNIWLPVGRHNITQM